MTSPHISKEEPPPLDDDAAAYEPTLIAKPMPAIMRPMMSCFFPASRMRAVSAPAPAALDPSAPRARGGGGAHAAEATWPPPPGSFLARRNVRLVTP
jgi:hypothetical protein